MEAQRCHVRIALVQSTYSEMASGVAALGKAERSTTNVVAAGFARRSAKDARKRLGQLAFLVGLLVVFLYPVRAWLLFGFNHPVWLAEVLPLGGAGVALDLATLLTTRSKSLRDDRVLRWGYVYFVLRTAVLAVYPTRLFTLLGYDPPGLTLAFGFALLFPLFLSLSARSTLVAVSAALGLQALVALMVSAIAPSPSVIAHVVALSVLMVFASWVCTRVASTAEVGGYQLERRIDREVYGSLWLAHHPHLARPAAIRTMERGVWRNARRPGPRMIERFARASASLRSPHALMLYDYGTAPDGSLYFASEFLEGEVLEDYVRRVGVLPVQTALTFALEVNEALIEAHERGLTHHGVTPRNVTLCKLGRTEQSAKLIRFVMSNIENVLGRSSRTTDAANPWQPPEEAMGQHSRKAGDIYQLGRLLEFMVTGRSFGGPGIDPLVPPSVRWMVEWCTRLDPAERPRAKELRHEIERALVALGERPRSRALDELTIVSSTGDSDASSSTAGLGASQVKRAANGDAGETKGRKAETVLGGHIVEAARRRLAQFAVADVVVSFGLTFLSQLEWTLNPDPDVLRETGLVLLAILALDLSLLVISKTRSLATDFVLQAAVAFFVIRSVLLATSIVRSYVVIGFAPPLMTFAPLLVLLLPLFVPLGPRALLLPAALSALAEPIALALLEPDVVYWQGSLLAAGTVFVMSQVLAHLLYGSRRIAAEREVFGAYRRGTLIGQGGNGEVWRARHDLLERPAALKLLSKAHLQSEEREAWLERFRREASVTSRLSSPYTVRIYDYGINEVGAAYSVMELLKGEDLHSYVKRTGSLSPEQVIAVALQICDSLGEAHDLGLVHRDVKPANVFLVRNADRTQVKVLDFGLADFAERLSTPEHSDGRFSGTPAFMPPEAFLGRPIDARSDIYELGCLLYFLLSGHNVFERTSLAALAIAHVRETPADLIKGGRKSVPPALAAVVARCLEKDPDERYASIDELEEDLLKVQDALEGWRATWPSEVLVTPPAPWADAPRDPR